MAPLERLRNHLANNDISAILLSNLPSIQWLCGFTGSFAQVIVTPDSGVFLTDSRYTIQAGEKCQNLPVRSFASPQKAEQFLAEQVSEL